MRMTKIMWKRFKSPFALVTGLVAGLGISASVAIASLGRDEVQPVPAPAVHVPVVEVKPVEHVAVAEVVEPDPVIERLHGLRIVGFLRGKNDAGEEKFYYQFTKAKRGEPPAALITSIELQVAGCRYRRKVFQ